ncbi:MAG: DUF72 domain-containing protein [Acidobacteria bacterium]|nr:DUF72 domain-containing protein [Acidobacteriota bacterium]NIM63760.1 DUF72 domain-containing protein [Acidobacteriota bacterium]NIO59329.1 DUF72 domain-containing protein [Acidobacteriota bacterium]NIQ30343.1 DUF72 domain-containing protein [Acidobacteriota bacterium]NIQ85280.1 DUF72 domain-containing protein [Acidobacteriota bacterium]
MIPGLFDGPGERLGTLDPPIRLGTSSWSAADWKGPFYPPRARPGDFLRHYAEHFDAVECDATFYATPASRTVEGWRAKTPEGFLLASKLPREITHDRGMVDCADVLRDHLRVMRALGSRLGPIVAQFAYVPRGRDAHEHATGDEFRSRLAAFLESWPRELELAVEVRNRKWIAGPLLDLLRDNGVGLVLPAYYTMPGPSELFAGEDPVTSDLIYVRFLGHHREMDARVARLQAEGKRAGEWSELALDRRDEMREWVEPLRERASAGKRVVTFFNNHYAGYAPGSVFLFGRLWQGA